MKNVRALLNRCLLSIKVLIFRCALAHFYDKCRLMCTIHCSLLRSKLMALTVRFFVLLPSGEPCSEKKNMLSKISFHFPVFAVSRCLFYNKSRIKIMHSCNEVEHRRYNLPHIIEQTRPHEAQTHFSPLCF